MGYFRYTHIWLLIPFVICIAGFWPSYWAKFFDASFRHHVHGLTATLWFTLLIIQPYLIQNKRIALHRLLGKFGLILGGGVFTSAIISIPYLYNIPWFSLETILKIIYWDLVTSFAYLTAIVMALLRVKTPAEHGRWLIITAILPLLPAQARLIHMLLGPTTFGIPTGYIGELLVILGLAVLLLRDYIKERKIYASYAFAFVTLIIVFLTADAVGHATWWRDSVGEFFKP